MSERVIPSLFQFRHRGRLLVVQTRRIAGWHLGIFRSSPFVVFDFGRLRIEVARASATFGAVTVRPAKLRAFRAGAGMFNVPVSTLSSNLPGWPGNVSTTADEPMSVLLSITQEDGLFAVRDFIGLRFGWGYLNDALVSWYEQVRDIIDIPDDELGEPLKSEVAAYRKALGL